MLRHQLPQYRSPRGLTSKCSDCCSKLVTLLARHHHLLDERRGSSIQYAGRCKDSKGVLLQFGGGLHLFTDVVQSYGSPKSGLNDDHVSST